MKANTKVVSIVIPTILTLCVELVLLGVCGASAVFWQECAISLVILAGAIACNLKSVQIGPIFGLSLGAITNVALLLQLLINIVLVIACPPNQVNHVGLILGLMLLALMAILAIASRFASNHAQSVETENDAMTNTMQEIRTRLDALAVSAPPKQKALVQKAANTARYTSPISNELTAQIDEQLIASINQLESQIDSHDETCVETTCGSIISLLAKRDSLAQTR